MEWVCSDSVSKGLGCRFLFSTLDRDWHRDSLDPGSNKVEQTFVNAQQKLALRLPGETGENVLSAYLCKMFSYIENVPFSNFGKAFGFFFVLVGVEGGRVVSL